jgi:hypothetical protein
MSNNEWILKIASTECSMRKLGEQLKNKSRWNRNKKKGNFDWDRQDFIRARTHTTKDLAAE